MSQFLGPFHKVDLFMWRGCGRVLELARGLKKANTVMNLETMAKRTGEVEKLAAEFSETAKAFRAKCYMHVDRQTKHVKGAWNFEKGGSEITISLNKLDEMTRPIIGKGIAKKGKLGDINYRELVKYEKEIGIWVSDKTGKRKVSKIGKIHYGMDGAYHVVPANPELIELFK